MGPLSRLTCNCLEVVQDPALVYFSVQKLAIFSRALATLWRQNKLSEIDVSEESNFLHTEALQTTIPVLWKILKTAMFACINILRMVMTRAIRDPSLAGDTCKSYPDTCIW